MKLQLGDHVTKSRDKDVFTGTIVSIFTALSGKELCVVENEFGILHIYSENLLRRTEDVCSCVNKPSAEEKVLVIAALRSALSSASSEKFTIAEINLMQKALRRVE